MKLNFDAICECFQREWEVYVKPADLPQELNTVLNMVAWHIADMDSLDDLPIEEKEWANTTPNIFITKEQEKREKYLHGAREDLYVIKEKLQDKGYTVEQIKSIFQTVMEDIV